MTIRAIDFGALYREHMGRAARRSRTADEWNARAPGMRRGIFGGPYVEGFLSRTRLDDCATLLDVGCGPGTIALSLAHRLERVYGLDYSPAMLEAFAGEAAERGITNATPILRDWNDDWSDVPVCDIVVASRSSQVDDLEPALLKLDAHARRRVHLTHLARGRFLDPVVYQVLGRRDDEPLPGYIYVVNILHAHGIDPTVDYIDGESRLRNCRDADDFLRKVSWSVGQLSDDEQVRLRQFFTEHPEQVGATPMRWAFISWDSRGVASNAGRVER